MISLLKRWFGRRLYQTPVFTGKSVMVYPKVGNPIPAYAVKVGPGKFGWTITWPKSANGAYWPLGIFPWESDCYEVRPRDEKADNGRD